MESKMKCPKCGQMEKTKNGFHRGKQRYKCKCCGCNYTGGRNGYPDHISRKLLNIILKVMDSEESRDWWGLAMYPLLTGAKSSLLNLKIFLKNVRKQRKILCRSLSKNENIISIK